MARDEQAGVPARSSAATPHSPDTPPARSAIAILVLVLMAFPLVIHGWGNPKLSYDYVTIVFPVDLAFAALLIAAARPLAQRIRSRAAGPGTTLWVAFCAVMTLAWFAHPSLRGVHTVFELWGTAALAGTLSETFNDRAAGIAVGTIGIVAALETAWATTQLVSGSALGLNSLGEAKDPFYYFSKTVKAPQGSMVHIYVLASFALLAGGILAWRAVSTTRPLPWLLGTAVAIVPVGFTFSRAGLLGFALLVLCVAAGAVPTSPRRLRYAAAAVALLLGAGIPAAVWHTGWHGRATQTTSASNSATLTTDRGHLDHEALNQIGAHPLTGVGPGRYVSALAQRYKVESDRSVGIFKPVHDIPLLVTAEGGILAGLIMVALYAAVGWRSVRAGPAPLGIFLAYMPFALLDHLAYSFPQGLVITGVWLAALDAVNPRDGTSWLEGAWPRGSGIGVHPGGD